ncbi:MAG: DNA polymerase III subunit gamma/tau, partial [Bacteroidetes bacterium]
MSQFVVSARKYRPMRFEDVVGQQHVTQTLKNALKRGQIAHAFLFCGPRGVGKTTCARILAKVLNCEQVTEAQEPCNECSSCKAFNEQASFNIIELDAASNNSVEHIRALVEQVRFQPQQGRYKVFIIDEVHMLSQAAFNAFLKTLEEPPPYAIFILATTEKHKIIPTILSRCQIFDFRRIQVPDIVAHLQDICRREGIEAEEDALHIIAQKADGALRDALSIFDRIAGYAGDKITYEAVIENLNILDYDYYFQFVDALLQEDMPRTLQLFDQVLKKGFEGDLFIAGFAEHLRNLLMAKNEATRPLLEVSDSLLQRYDRQARLTPASFLMSALNLANECDLQYKEARNKRLHVELTLMKMAWLNRAIELAAHSQPAAPAPEKKSPAVAEPPQTPAAQAPTPQAQTPTRPTEETAPPPADEEKPPAAPAPREKPAAPPGRTPSTRRVKSHLRRTPSISLDPVDAGEASDTKKEEKPALSQDQLLQAVNQYIENMDRETMATMLRNARFELDGHIVRCTATSPIMADSIRRETRLMDFLRDWFGNDQLALEVGIDEAAQGQRQQDEQRRPVTRHEQYHYLAAKNPLLRELQKRF